MNVRLQEEANVDLYTAMLQDCPAKAALGLGFPPSGSHLCG